MAAATVAMTISPMAAPPAGGSLAAMAERKELIVRHRSM